MAEIQHLPVTPKPPKAWLTLLTGGVLVFSGMVIGAGGTVFLVKSRMDQPGNSPEHFNRRLAERMTQDLGLIDEQESDIHQIFKAHQEELREVKQAFRSKIDTSFATMQIEVESILTQEQSAVWNDRIRQYNSRGARDRSPRRGDDPKHDEPPPLRDGEPGHDEFDRPLPYRDGPPDGRMRDGRRPSPSPREDYRDGEERRSRERYGDFEDRPRQRRRPNDAQQDNQDGRPDDDGGIHRPPPPPPQ